MDTDHEDDEAESVNFAWNQTPWYINYIQTIKHYISLQETGGNCFILLFLLLFGLTIPLEFEHISDLWYMYINYVPKLFISNKKPE